MTPGSSRFGRWWHRHCLAQAEAFARDRERTEEMLARDRDRLEGEVIRLRKQYEDLFTAYRSLTDATLFQLRPPTSFAQALFEEIPPTDPQKIFLTPVWAEREGEPEPTV